MLPLDLLVSPPPALGRPISRSDTLALSVELCKVAGWLRCFDFLWLNRFRPIYSDLYATARETVSGRCWVLSHALQILQNDVHIVAISSFSNLLEEYRTVVSVEQKLEELMCTPWKLTLAQAELLFWHTSTFELRAGKKEMQNRKFEQRISISELATVYYPLRDWCFLTILCLAHQNIIWPDDPPDVFTATLH